MVELYARGERRSAFGARKRELRIEWRWVEEDVCASGAACCGKSSRGRAQPRGVAGAAGARKPLALGRGRRGLSFGSVTTAGILWSESCSDVRGNARVQTQRPRIGETRWRGLPGPALGLRPLQLPLRWWLGGAAHRRVCSGISPWLRPGYGVTEATVPLSSECEPGVGDRSR